MRRLDPAPVGLAEAAAVWFAEKLDAIDDPEFVAIYLEYDAAFDWPADDPRLNAVADRAERWLVRRGDVLTSARQPAAGPGIVQLIATSTGTSSPAWDRLREIAQERTVGGLSVPGGQTAHIDVSAR